ncbi:MAG: TRAP transporter large permease subunit [Pseudomonadota bacterium]
MIAENLHILMFAAACFALLCGYHVALTLGGIALIFAGIGLALDIFPSAMLIAFPSRILGTMQNQVLAAIPLFVLMGVVLERSHVAEDLLEAAGRLLSRIRGGLGYSVVLVGALLAASTGIVGATVVTMTLIALPSMLSQGYDKRVASGVIAASGTLGQIIPPSIVLIVLADVISNANSEARRALGEPPTPVSPGDLFAGALVPGLMLVGLYLTYLAVISLVKPSWTPARAADAQDEDTPPAWRTAFAFGAPLVLIIAVLGSILGGLASPTEAAAVGAIGAILIAGARILLDRPNSQRHIALIAAGGAALPFLIVLSQFFDLRLGGDETKTAADQIALWAAYLLCALLAMGVAAACWALASADRLKGSLTSAAQVTAMVFLILIGAALFSIVFRGFGGDEFVAELLNGIPGGLWGALAATMLMMFVLGFFLDFMEITFVVVPLVAPPLIMMGADPVWLGVLMAINLQTSFLTPPFGFALFYLKGAAPEGLETPDIWRGAIPFIGLQLIGLAAVASFPELVSVLR